MLRHAYMSSLFLHDFTVLDCAIFHSENGLMGESVHISAELFGSLDHRGFIFDFSPAKKALKSVVDDTLDHKLLIQESLANGGNILELKTKMESYSYTAPAESVALLPGTSFEEIALYLEDQAMKVLPKNVRSVKFSVREESSFQNNINFRYTHGLRYHEGNCQRLFHGHRNRLEVWVGEERDIVSEKILADEWHMAHFTAKETISSGHGLSMGIRTKASNQVEIRYHSTKGSYQAIMPSSRIILVEEEPSIENLARLGVERLQAMGKKPSKVVVFEGLNKGASFRG